MPWAVMCLASGFNEDAALNKQQRIPIEQKIQGTISLNFTVFQRHASAAAVLDTFVKIVEEEKQSIAALRVIIIGRVTVAKQSNQ